MFLAAFQVELRANSNSAQESDRDGRGADALHSGFVADALAVRVSLSLPGRAGQRRETDRASKRQEEGGGN